MNAARPIDEELAAALQSLGRDARKSCEKARSKRSPKAVHAARTCLRRAEAAVGVVDALGLDRRHRARRTRKELHALERALGGTRDDDVLLRTLAEGAGAKPGDGLRQLIGRVRRHRGKRARRLAKSRLPAGTFRRLARLARRGVVSRRPPEGSARALPVLVRHRVGEALVHALSAVLAYDVRLGLCAEDEVIHRVRSSARELRYVLDLFDGALPPPARRLAAELHALQSRLGSLHDRALAVARTREWLEQGKVDGAKDIFAWMREEERIGDRMREGFAREWCALQRGFQRRVFEVLANVQESVA